MAKTLTIFAALPALLVASRVLLAVVDGAEFYVDSLAQTHTAIATAAAAVAAAVWSIAADPSLAAAGCIAVIAVRAASDTVRIRRILRNERAAAAPRPGPPAAHTR